MDIDNDRFHPFAQAYLGQFPAQSKAHHDKHLAIRMLKITPEEIMIEADCDNLEAMRLIKNECDGLENLLRAASYHWSSIAPRGFQGALPSFNSPKLRLDGIDIPLDLAKTRFRISQQKAFSLLQGENIYSGFFPFVRELLQNAIDSTKIQAYMDYKTSSKFRFEDSTTGIMPSSMKNISQMINPVEYPIEITISCCMLKEGEVCEEIDLKSVPEIEEEGVKYGILFSIKDYGTGIDKKTLRAISAVGTSYKNRKKLLREIPEWLRPTGEFGIGLQSVFLVSDKFYCDTYVRNGERYFIEFLTGANGEKGYINVQPKDADADPMAYGTEFRVFIGYDKKKIRSEFMDAWTGYDPFADEYVNKKIQRDIVALTTQIILDIDGQIEDLLFPVYTSVKFDMGKEQREQIDQKLSKIVFCDTQVNGRYTKENLNKHVCWMYRNESKNDSIHYIEIEDGFCMVDLYKMQINLWMEDVSINACIGVEHLVRNGFQVMKSPCKLYYKGILIETDYIEKSGNLLEYIDIQGGRCGSQLIQLSRNGFTKEGKYYIHKTIIPQIYEKFQKVLEALASLTFKEGSDENRKTIGMADKIKVGIEKALEHFTIDPMERQRQIIGISLYYDFYMRSLEKDQRAYISEKLRNEKHQWNCAIGHVENSARKAGKQIVQKSFDNIEDIKVIKVYASFKDRDFTVLDEPVISIADFYDRRNRFAVVSKRRERGDNWINTLVWLKGTKDSVRAEDDTKTPEPKLIEALEQRITENSSWGEKEKDLEQWAEFLLQMMESIIEKQSVQQSTLVLNLMQSVSISACFSDTTGNLKLHILSGQSKGEVFYNLHAKYMLLKKMVDRNKKTNARRFAGNVWMGYEFLSLREIQDDICNIKEKYIGGNEEFMLFPCSGAASKELVQFAESQEDNNADWQDINEKMMGIADELESCMTFDYRLCISEYKDLFDSSFSEYCQREREYINAERFIFMLDRRYQVLLKNELREIKNLKTIEKKMTKEDIYSRMDKDFDIEEIKRRKRDITKQILQNQEKIIDNQWYYNKDDMPPLMHANLKEIAQDCYHWEVIWKQIEQLQHMQFEEKFEDIKKEHWIDTKERKNLIGWTASQIHSNQDEVGECYEHMWDELKRVVEYRYKGNIIEKYQYKFIDWLES